MSKFTHHFGRIFLWTFERGSRAFDIIVILILLFIFLTPHSCFEKRPKPHSSPPQPSSELSMEKPDIAP